MEAAQMLAQRFRVDGIRSDFEGREKRHIRRAKLRTFLTHQAVRPPSGGWRRTPPFARPPHQVPSNDLREGLNIPTRQLPCHTAVNAQFTQSRWRSPASPAPESSRR